MIAVRLHKEDHVARLTLCGVVIDGKTARHWSKRNIVHVRRVVPVEVHNIGILDSAGKGRIVPTLSRRSLSNLNFLLSNLGTASSNNVNSALSHSGHNAVSIDGGNARVRCAPCHRARKIVGSINSKLTNLKRIVARNTPVAIYSYRSNSTLIVLSINIVVIQIGNLNISSRSSFLSIFLLLGLQRNLRSMSKIRCSDGVNAVCIGCQLGCGAVNGYNNLVQVVSVIRRSTKRKVRAGRNRQRRGRQLHGLCIAIGDISVVELEGDSCLSSRSISSSVLRRLGAFLRIGRVVLRVGLICRLRIVSRTLCSSCFILLSRARLIGLLLFDSNQPHFLQLFCNSGGRHTRKHHRCRDHYGHSLNTKDLYSMRNQAVSLIHISHPSQSPRSHTVTANSSMNTV